MKTKILFYLFIFLGVTLSAMAQDDASFEGEITYRNFENYNKVVLKFSKGMAYNGARNVKVLIKGYNMHIIDESLHMHTLLLPGEDKAIIFNDLLKKGQQFPFTEYVNNYLSSFSPEDHVVSGVTLSNTSTIKDTGETKEYKGQLCKIYKGQVIANNGGTTSDIELWVSSKYDIYKCYWYFVNGIQVPGIVLKWTYDTKGKVPLFGQMSGFVASELKTIEERVVTEEEMQVPSDYDITVSKSPFKVLKLYGSTTKYLKKNGMYPTQIESDVTYKIDEEWDF